MYTNMTRYPGRQGGMGNRISGTQMSLYSLSKLDGPAPRKRSRGHGGKRPGQKVKYSSSEERQYLQMEKHLIFS